jgi:hypothetical protein
MCHSPEHTMQFWMDDDDPPTLYAHVFLSLDPWWQRIWNSVKYILGYKCRYGHFDEFLLNPEDCDKFIELLTRYKKASEKYPTAADIDRMR